MNVEDMQWLLDEARSGNRAARNALLEAHLGIAGNAARSRRDRDDARSSAILGMVLALDAYVKSGRPATELSAYLKGTALNAAIDADRNEVRHVARLKAKYGGLNEKVDAPDSEHAHLARAKAARRELSDSEAREALNNIALGRNEIEVMRLKMEGLSNREVSARSGLSEATISRLLEDMRVRWIRRERLEHLLEDIL